MIAPTVRAAAWLVLLTGVAVLAGYALHLPQLVRVAPGLQGMSPLTAVGLGGVAVALLAFDLRRPRLSAVANGFSLILAIGVLIVHLVQGRDAISPALAQAVFGYPAATAGRMSAATALCLAALALAGLARARAWAADIAGAAALVVAGVALLGYAYGVQDLYALAMFRTMALHTAVAIVVLALASLFVRPERGWASIVVSREAGGGTTRRQLAFILLPPLAGGFLLRATDSHRLGPNAAMAFLVVFTVIPLAVLILRDGQILNVLSREQAERTRLQADQAGLLQQRLAAQAAELSQQSAERMKAEAAVFRVQRMEAVGQLTGGIAHDFNNLLMAIGGNLQLLLKRLPEDHPTRRYADNAAAAADRGAKLTGQLLAFSRTQRMDIRAVELDPILRGARDLLGAAMGPTVDVSLRLDADGCWTSTDSDQLELAVLNLAINARDAMPDGGAITVMSGPCRTRLDAGADERDYLSIRVVDTGEGMAPEVIDQAVEPFFTTKERGKGTGLGLAQVYGFVRQSGGDIRITSQVGVGTTVELLLPCVPAPAARADAIVLPGGHAGASTADPAPDGRLVLVIDDDTSVRDVLVETLAAAGFTIVSAGSGAEGLEHLERIRPAAAIIDFMMPGMNGAEVARRAQAVIPDLPIIFVSGYFDTVALDGIRGAVVLRKPFDIEGLHRAVTSALQ